MENQYCMVGFKEKKIFYPFEKDSCISCVSVKVEDTSRREIDRCGVFDLEIGYQY